MKLPSLHLRPSEISSNLYFVPRFLCSEPLSVQFSMWNKNEMMIPRGEDDWRCLCFNWINCNVGGAIDDGKMWTF